VHLLLTTYYLLLTTYYLLLTTYYLLLTTYYLLLERELEVHEALVLAAELLHHRREQLGLLGLQIVRGRGRVRGRVRGRGRGEG